MKHICGEDGCKWVTDEEYARIMLERAIKEKEEQEKQKALLKKQKKLKRK